MRLEIAKGLEKEEPFEAFERNPNEETISRISKKLHTQEMLDKIFSNSRKPDNDTRPLLTLISKSLITFENCKRAIFRDGRNARYTPHEFFNQEFCEELLSNHMFRCIPEEYMTVERCLAAVQYSWTELRLVPMYMRNKKICDCAIKQSFGAIAYLPKTFITKEIAVNAIINSVVIMAEAKEKKCYITWPIEYVPKKMLTKELIMLSISVSSDSINNIPERFISKEIAISMVQHNGMSLRHVPEKYRANDKIIEIALKNNPAAFRYVPEEKKTHELCEAVYLKMPQIVDIQLSAFPEEYREEFLFRYKSQYQKDILCLEPPEKIEYPIVSSVESLSTQGDYEVYDLADSESRQSYVSYYVSDLHIEHQLGLFNMPLFLVEEAIRKKIDELISSAPDTDCLLLIPGDIADGYKLSELFYRQLIRQWEGPIISTLGNHELWDLYKEESDNSDLDSIFGKFRAGSMNRRSYSFLLENELLLYYKGMKWVNLTEKEIMEADQKELSEICDKSSIVILGGVGFSWCNPVFNADMGLYKDTLSRSEEIERSTRFLNVYRKIEECANHNRVIVLTHNPPEDWTKKKLNSNWVYVCGHTHRNHIHIEDNGSILLNNNQIGYRPRKWYLKGFNLEQKAQYDPLAYLQDGIHNITSQKYIEFNQCAGIQMDNFVRPGHIFALKHDGIYMFLYQEHILSILNGGALSKAEHDIDYYFENLSLFASKVKKAFEPYHSALTSIGEWIRKHGGKGSVHGCIVDIDLLNHIYLDPYDAKAKFYFATDMTNKVFFRDLNHLLQDSPIIYCKESLQKALISDSDGIPILLSNGTDSSLTPVPEAVLDRAMYEPSRNMRSIQYAIENNVVRFWRDAILEQKY